MMKKIDSNDELQEKIKAELKIGKKTVPTIAKKIMKDLLRTPYVLMLVDYLIELKQRQLLP